MYSLEKKMEISCMHFLPDHPGACREIHGHNWNITVHCACKDADLNDQGMIVDFGEIKKVVNQPDHGTLNNFLENPTAENIAKWICDQIPTCYMVEVEETRGNKALYRDDKKSAEIFKALS